MNSKPAIANTMLVLFMVLENLCFYVFYQQGILSQGKNAILLFLCSVLWGCALLYKFYNKQIAAPAPATAKSKALTYGAAAGFAALLVLLGTQYQAFFLSRPPAKDSADIIPVIEIMCRRLLEGKFPYAIITKFGFDQHTSYFPLHWLPFTFAELAQADYRWVPYIIWCIGALWLCIRSMQATSIATKLALPLVLLASNYILLTNKPGIVEGTVELMIAAYYMMLMAGMNSCNGIVQGVVLALCVLSRYSLVLWLPLYAFVLYISGHRKLLYTAIATVAAIAIVLFVIPFLSKDWTILQGYKYYDSAALYEWTHMNKDGRPLHLWAGTGFAYFFYSRFTGLDIMDRVKLLQRAQLICSIAAVVIMGIWYWYRRQQIDKRIFLMGSFKIYLAIFLFLIQVPYEYLMCVGNFVTIAIFCEQARYKINVGGM